MLWCRHSMIPDSGIMLWLVKCLHVGRFVVLLTVLCSFYVKLLLFGKQYKFLCETFCSSLSSKKSKKYICDQLEEENLSIQNVELSWYSPVINNYGQISLYMRRMHVFFFYLFFFIASNTHTEKKQKLHRINKVIKRKKSNK